MSSLMARLPDELLARCAAILDLLAAGRLAQASRAGQHLVLTRLVEDKAERDARAATTAAVAVAEHVALMAAGKAFIDAYTDLFIGASSAGRKMVVGHIISAATGDERLGSTNWTVLTVHNRLLHMMKVRRYM